MARRRKFRRNRRRAHHQQQQPNKPQNDAPINNSVMNTPVTRNPRAILTPIQNLDIQKHIETNPRYKATPIQSQPYLENQKNTRIFTPIQNFEAPKNIDNMRMQCESRTPIGSQKNAEHSRALLTPVQTFDHKILEKHSLSETPRLFRSNSVISRKNMNSEMHSLRSRSNSFITTPKNSINCTNLNLLFGEKNSVEKQNPKMFFADKDNLKRSKSNHFYEEPKLNSNEFKENAKLIAEELKNIPEKLKLKSNLITSSKEGIKIKSALLSEELRMNANLLSEELKINPNLLSDELILNSNLLSKINTNLQSEEVLNLLKLNPYSYSEQLRLNPNLFNEEFKSISNLHCEELKRSSREVNNIPLEFSSNVNELRVNSKNINRLNSPSQTNSILSHNNSKLSPFIEMTHTTPVQDKRTCSVNRSVQNNSINMENKLRTCSVDRHAMNNSQSSPFIGMTQTTPVSSLAYTNNYETSSTNNKYSTNPPISQNIETSQTPVTKFDNNKHRTSSIGRNYLQTSPYIRSFETTPVTSKAQNATHTCSIDINNRSLETKETMQIMKSNPTCINNKCTQNYSINKTAQICSINKGTPNDSKISPFIKAIETTPVTKDIDNKGNSPQISPVIETTPLTRNINSDLNELKMNSNRERKHVHTINSSSKIIKNRSETSPFTAMMNHSQTYSAKQNNRNNRIVKHRRSKSLIITNNPQTWLMPRSNIANASRISNNFEKDLQSQTSLNEINLVDQNNIQMCNSEKNNPQTLLDVETTQMCNSSKNNCHNPKEFKKCKINIGVQKRPSLLSTNDFRSTPIMILREISKNKLPAYPIIVDDPLCAQFFKNDLQTSPVMIGDPQLSDVHFSPVDDSQSSSIMVDVGTQTDYDCNSNAKQISTILDKNKMYSINKHRYYKSLSPKLTRNTWLKLFNKHPSPTLSNIKHLSERTHSEIPKSFSPIKRSSIHKSDNILNVSSANVYARVNARVRSFHRNHSSKWFKKLLEICTSLGITIKTGLTALYKPKTTDLFISAEITNNPQQSICACKHLYEKKIEQLEEKILDMRTNCDKEVEAVKKEMVNLRSELMEMMDKKIAEIKSSIVKCAAPPPPPPPPPMMGLPPPPPPPMPLNTSTPLTRNVKLTKVQKDGKKESTRPVISLDDILNVRLRKAGDRQQVSTPKIQRRNTQPFISGDMLKQVKLRPATKTPTVFVEQTKNAALSTSPASSLTRLLSKADNNVPRVKRLKRNGVHSSDDLYRKHAFKREW